MRGTIRAFGLLAMGIGGATWFAALAVTQAEDDGGCDPISVAGQTASAPAVDIGRRS